jgi:hypothetical protein
LWDSAVDSAVLAFLVLIMGSITVGIVGDLLRDMAPSLPPGLAHKPALEAAPSPTWDSLRHWFEGHRFAILFALIFTAKMATRLIRHSPNAEHRNAAAWSQRLYRRVADQWFGLVVANAFTAFGLAFAFQWTRGFTLTQILWRVVADLFSPLIHAVTAFLPGAGLLGNLVDWYNENQFKFTFWLLYSAAICDDLGLPNYKALGRWLWRHVRKARPGVLPAASSPSSPP